MRGGGGGGGGGGYGRERMWGGGGGGGGDAGGRGCRKEGMWEGEDAGGGDAGGGGAGGGAKDGVDAGGGGRNLVGDCSLNLVLGFWSQGTWCFLPYLEGGFCWKPWVSDCRSCGGGAGCLRGICVIVSTGLVSEPGQGRSSV